MIQTYINNAWIDIASPMFVSEMESLEKDETRQSARAAYGGHDDRIVAVGMLLFSWYVNELRGPKAALVERRLASEGDVDPRWSPGWQGRDITPGKLPSPMEHIFARVAEEQRRARRGAQRWR